MENNDRPIILRSYMGRDFADRVCHFLDTKYNGTFDVGEITIKPFPDGEPNIKIEASVDRRRVYVIHSFQGYGDSGSPHEQYDSGHGSMALFFINDALMRAGAEKIINVLPHPPYQRQDRKEEGRVPISSAVFMDLLSHSGGKAFERLITMEMHSGQQQGFGKYPVDNLYANEFFARYFSQRGDGFVVVSPDEGGGKRARDLAHRLRTHHVYSSKLREGTEKKGVEIIGDLQGKKRAIIPDDMTDSSTTLCLAAKELYDRGVEEVYACVTHPELSPTDGIAAEERIQEVGLKLVVGDTMPMSQQYINDNRDWLTVISFAPLFGRVIYERETRGSVSRLFTEEEHPDIPLITL